MNTILYRLTIRNMLRSKKIWFALVMSLLPIFISLLVAYESRRSSFTPALWDSLFLILSFTLIVTALILAGGLMSDEVEDRTISYLLTLPIRRWDLFMSRAIGIGVIMGILAVLQGFGAYIGELASYLGTDQGFEFDRGSSISAGTHMGIGFIFALIFPPIIAVTYVLIAGTMSLVVGKWHLIPVFALVLLDLVGSMGIGFPMGPISACYTIYAAALDTGANAGHWIISLIMLPLYLFAWGWLGAKMTERKDFHVTSAVT